MVRVVVTENGRSVHAMLQMLESINVLCAFADLLKNGLELLCTPSWHRPTLIGIMTGVQSRNTEMGVLIRRPRYLTIYTFQTSLYSTQPEHTFPNRYLGRKL